MHGKYIFGASLIFILSIATLAQADTPAAAATNAPAAPAANSPAQAAWNKIKADFTALQAAQSEDEAKKLMPTLAGETKDFFTKFPDDMHALNATMLWAQLGQDMSAHNIAGGPPQEEIDKTFEKLATDPKVPKPRRAEIRAMQISQSLQKAAGTNDPSAWDETEKRFDAFEKEFGADFAFDGQQHVLPVLRGQELQALAQSPDPTRYNALLKKLDASSDPQLKALATQAQEQQKKLADLKSKPLDLKYTAVDGRDVDLSKLRGKVVLVDFWATWCPPCREEVPDVVAAYGKYHDKGFDVVGVSLDQDKDALQSFTKEKGMAWPQYFDGKGWDNAISSRFGIDSIPAMWLLDKKGMVVSTDARDDLDAEIAKLLAAP
ncbi:MAG TPA: redoxin family protein [Candidatus Methylacidiphilales bacterium]|jgi:thiol-disulfide isomerase/thioredoxin|nr:redoxin family protein [Candidatus Methylacidiphilales bacterium]